MLTILIDSDQNPEKRMLVHDEACIFVCSGCCGARLRNEEDKHFCTNCNALLVFDTDWASEIPFAAIRRAKIDPGEWSEWLEFWFQVSDMSMEIQWND